MTASTDIPGLIERLRKLERHHLAEAQHSKGRQAVTAAYMRAEWASEAADALKTLSGERAITDDGNAPGFHPDPTFNGPPLEGAALSVGEQPVAVKPPRRIIYVTETSPEAPNSFPVYLDQMGERNDRIASQARADAIEGAVRTAVLIRGNIRGATDYAKGEADMAAKIIDAIRATLEKDR